MPDAQEIFRENPFANAEERDFYLYELPCYCSVCQGPRCTDGIVQVRTCNRLSDLKT